MDEPEKKPDWLASASIVLGIVLVVIAAVLLLILLWPTLDPNIFQTGPDNLWLHVDGL